MTRAAELEAFLARAPFAKTLGLRCQIHGDEMTAVLPFEEKLIGNAAIRALHGGAIGSFLELTAMAQVFLLTDAERPPKTIDLTIDYLRSGRPEDAYARAYVTKLGRRIANVRCEAWQASRSKPIATLHAHFLVEQKEGTGAERD
ncbi:MAG: PaaI family thioesterase [Pseudomonadota bacterium]